MAHQDTSQKIFLSAPPEEEAAEVHLYPPPETVENITFNPSPSKRPRYVEPGRTRPRRGKKRTVNATEPGYTSGAVSPDLRGSPPTPDGRHSPSTAPFERAENAADGSAPDDIGTEPSNYSLYAEAIQSGTCGIYQLTRDVFIVQGWDLRRGASTVSTTHHGFLIQITYGP